MFSSGDGSQFGDVRGGAAQGRGGFMKTVERAFSLPCRYSYRHSSALANQEDADALDDALGRIVGGGVHHAYGELQDGADGLAGFHAGVCAGEMFVDPPGGGYGFNLLGGDHGRELLVRPTGNDGGTAGRSRTVCRPQSCGGLRRKWRGGVAGAGFPSALRGAWKFSLGSLSLLPLV